MLTSRIVEIEGVQDRIIARIIEDIGEDKVEFHEWVPMMKEWLSVLGDSLKESFIKRLDFSDEQFTSYKRQIKKIIDELTGYLYDVTSEEPEIEDLWESGWNNYYDYMEDNIWKKGFLTGSQIFMLMYSLLKRLNNRIENESFGTYYELMDVQKHDGKFEETIEVLKGKDMGVPENKKIKRIKERTQYYMWIAFFDGMDFSQPEIHLIKTKFQLEQTVNTCHKVASQVIKWKAYSETGKRPEIGYCQTHKTTVMNLNAVIEYYDQKNEVEKKNKVIELRDKAYARIQ